MGHRALAITFMIVAFASYGKPVSHSSESTDDVPANPVHVPEKLPTYGEFRDCALSLVPKGNIGNPGKDGFGLSIQGMFDYYLTSSGISRFENPPLSAHVPTQMAFSIEGKKEGIVRVVGNSATGWGPNGFPIVLGFPTTNLDDYYLGKPKQKMNAAKNQTPSQSLSTQIWDADFVSGIRKAFSNGVEVASSILKNTELPDLNHRFEPAGTNQLTSQEVWKTNVELFEHKLSEFAEQAKFLSEVKACGPFVPHQELANYSRAIKSKKAQFEEYKKTHPPAA